MEITLCLFVEDRQKYWGTGRPFWHFSEGKTELFCNFHPWFRAQNGNFHTFGSTGMTEHINISQPKVKTSISDEWFKRLCKKHMWSTFKSTATIEKTRVLDIVSVSKGLIWWCGICHLPVKWRLALLYSWLLHTHHEFHCLNTLTERPTLALSPRSIGRESPKERVLASAPFPRPPSAPFTWVDDMLQPRHQLRLNLGQRLLHNPCENK